MPYAGLHEPRSPANDAMVAGGHESPCWRHRLRQCGPTVRLCVCKIPSVTSTPLSMT
jgi:hypothetical protein